MKRKLIKQGGGGGLTLYVPKKWIDKNRLKGGDEVEVFEDNNRLILDSKVGAVKKSIELDITELHVKTVQQVLKSIYREGYTEAKIHFKNKITKHIKHSYLIKEFPELNIKQDIPTAELIYDNIKNCIGFEVIDQKDNLIVVKQVSKADEEEFDVTLRRVFRLMYELNTDFCANAESNKYELSITAQKIANIRKFINYCIRLIKMNIIKDNSFDLFYILKRFENMTHFYEFLAMITSTHKNKIEKKTIEMIKEFGELIDFVHKAFYDFSIDKYDLFDINLRAMYHKHNISCMQTSKFDLRVRQTLTFGAMDLTDIMNKIIAININKGFYSKQSV